MSGFVEKEVYPYAVDFEVDAISKRISFFLNVSVIVLNSVLLNFS